MNRRRALLAAATAGSLFALTASLPRAGRLHDTPGAARAQDARPADTFQRVWAQFLPDFHSAALSADGHSIVTVGAAGRVRLWDWQGRPGRALWSRLVPGVSQAEVTTGGHQVLAYAPLDPTRKSLYFLGDAGRLTGRSTLDGAVWNVGLSADGSCAGVTTGGHSLYFYTLGTQPARRIPLSGIGNSVSLTRQGDRLVAGTWDGSGVACYTSQGATLWQYPVDPQARQSLSDRLFEAQIARNGQAVLGISYANVHEGDGTLYFWRGDGDGRPVWTRPLGEDAFDPQTRISEDGRCVAVTYTRLITHDDQSVAERRLLVLDGAGNTLWEKGGLLFAPTLLSVAADGHRVTVSDGRSTLYHLNGDGRITAPYRLHGAIRRAVASPDGRWLLVYTSDGLLSLMKLG